MTDEIAYMDSQGVLHFNGDRMNGSNAMIWALGHELVHHAENRTGNTGSITEDILSAFTELNDVGALSGQTKAWMDDVDARIQTLADTYRAHEASREGGNPDSVNEAYAREELAGDLMRKAFADDGLLLRLAGEKPSLIQEAEKALSRVRAKISGDVQERAFVETRETLDAMERRFEDALKRSPAQESAAQDRYEVSDPEAEPLQNQQAGDTIGAEKNSLTEDSGHNREGTAGAGAYDSSEKRLEAPPDGGAGETDPRVRGELSASSGRYGGVNPSFGAKPIRTWAEGHIVEPGEGSIAYTEQQTAMDYGVPSFVVSDEAWAKNKGSAPAFSTDG